MEHLLKQEFLTFVNDRLHRELIAGPLCRGAESGNVFLLAKSIRRRKHCLYLPQVVLFKTPAKKANIGLTSSPTDTFTLEQVVSPIRLLVHHILDALLDLGERDGLRAVEQHPDDGLRTAEHLGQKFELVGQGETRRDGLSESVVTLVSWELLSETNTEVQQKTKESFCLFKKNEG